VIGEKLGLYEILSSGPVPVEEVMRFGLQIPEALEAAHEKGVIPRDLKAADIMVNPERKVKALDFGLAKAYAGELVLDIGIGIAIAVDIEHRRETITR
jgi:serine/threonine protein kinase